MKTRSQVYAKDVFERVSDFKRRCADTNGGTGNAKIKEYGSMAHKLPVLIRTAGLAQALAFVAASGSKKQQEQDSLHPHRQLLEDLAKVVSQTNAEQFLEASRGEEIGEYLRFTRESLAALLWFKRFAQSVLDVDIGDEPASDRTQAA